MQENQFNDNHQNGASRPTDAPLFLYAGMGVISTGKSGMGIDTSRDGSGTFASAKGHCEALDQWICRRLRMCLRKQWKRVRTRYRGLRASGMPEHLVHMTANSRRGPWKMSRILNTALDTRYWQAQGLVRNRRMRTRMYSGMRGRGACRPLLLDSDVVNDFSVVFLPAPQQPLPPSPSPAGCSPPARCRRTPRRRSRRPAAPR